MCKIFLHMFVHVPYVFVTKQNALTDGEFINKFLYIIFEKSFPMRH